MAYKMIPVDQETYDMVLVLCEASGLKQGAQVKALVRPAWRKLTEDTQGEFSQLDNPELGVVRDDSMSK